MAFFPAVIVLYLAQIAYQSAKTILVLMIVFFGLNRLGGNNSDGRNRTLLALSMLTLSTAIFLLLPSISERLWIIGTGS